MWKLDRLGMLQNNTHSLWLQSSEFKYNKQLFMEKAKKWTEKHAIQKIMVRVLCHVMIIWSSMLTRLYWHTYKLSSVLHPFHSWWKHWPNFSPHPKLWLLNSHWPKLTSLVWSVCEGESARAWTDRSLRNVGQYTVMLPNLNDIRFCFFVYHLINVSLLFTIC